MAKRTFKDNEMVIVKQSGLERVIIGYRKGHEYPYKVRTSQGNKYCSFRGLTRQRDIVAGMKKATARPSATILAIVEKRTVNKENDSMGYVASKIRELSKSKEQRLFEDYGITDTSGALTSEGRLTVMDKLWEDDDLRKAVLADLETIKAEEEKRNKK